MSQVVQIDNSNYEFEILLVKGDKPEAENVEVLPVSKEIIKYLEIEDSFSNIGFTGKIIFSSFNSIFERTGIFDLENGNAGTNIFIRFKNLDFEAINVDNIPEVFLFAALNESGQTGRNEIDRHTNFTFEDLEVVKLKRRSVLKSIESVNDGQDEIELSIPEAEDIQDIIKYLIELAVDEDTSVITLPESSAGSNVSTPTQLEGSDFSTLTPMWLSQDKSIFDSIMTLYDYLSYRDDFPVPGIIKLVQTQDNTKKYKKAFSITPFNLNIFEFFKLLKESPTDTRIGNYLLEKFVLQSPDHDSTSLSENIITKYNVERVNYNEVLTKKWLGLYYTRIDNDAQCSITDSETSYDVLVEQFENLFTDKYKSNLPKSFSLPKLIKYSTTGLSDILGRAYGVSKVFSSFIFDNVAITFRVKGNTYRTSDKFVQISSDKKDLDGYWYVISVKHIFLESVYENEITCVRFYLDEERTPTSVPPSTGDSQAISLSQNSFDVEGVNEAVPVVPLNEQPPPDAVPWYPHNNQANG